MPEAVHRHGERLEGEPTGLTDALEFMKADHAAHL
jgi:hypothetical protein